MKRNSCYSLAALLLAVCLALTACGASSGSSASSTAAYASPSMMKADFAPAAVAMTEAATDDTAARVNSAAGESTPMDSSRKIVRNAWLSLETKEFDTALSSLSALISEKGGYIESQSEDGRSLRQSGYYSRSASITARIPAEQLDAVISAAGGFCNIVSRSTSSDDITDRYFDSEARLRSLELQEERLLDILSKAEKLDDVITLEQALSEVRYEIESLTASLRRMDSQVAYSTLNIDLSEVVDYQQPSIQPKSFGERIAAAWSRSVERMGDIAEGLVLFAVEALPSILLFLVLPVLAILFIIRAVRRSRRAKRSKTASVPVPEPAKKED